MTTSAIGTHLGQHPGPLLGSTSIAGDDCFAALVVVLGASLVSVAALRWRRPTRLSFLVALVSTVACGLASVLPRAVGADTAQPIRASLLILALGATAVACVRPGAWRRLAVCLHVACGFAVAVLSVDLVGSHLDALGRPRYVVPTDQEERAELRPTWHTPVTGVYRNPHAQLPRLAARRPRRSCSAGSVPMTEHGRSGFQLAYAWGWCPPGSTVAKKRWLSVIGVDEVGRSWVEEMSATIDRRTGATANPTIWWLDTRGVAVRCPWRLPRRLLLAEATRASLVMSPDGALVASVEAEDIVVRLVASGSIVFRRRSQLEGAHSRSLWLSTGNTRISERGIRTSERGERLMDVATFDLRSGSVLFETRLHGFLPSGCGYQLVQREAGGPCAIVDESTGEDVGCVSAEHISALPSRDGWLAFRDGTVEVLDVQGRHITQAALSTLGLAHAFVAGGRRVISWTQGRIALRDAATGRELASATAREYASTTRPRLIADESRGRVLVVTEISTAYGVSDWDPRVHCWAFA